ncbi:hypothetical protein [Hyalangium rubrum]|uniref:Uncharacterized protein n=1 Tax=Hyalangium rubrum TaxID=3103134 RepID=A0ABU5H3V3_9BACT|nr:hypothetical protein [Hyalangium sp. s54d21]MDY7228139.1 hypothetical protein [Hyalangium sp. s54d21]
MDGGVHVLGLCLLKLLGEETANHYRMGQLYNYVVAHQLAEAAEYKNAQEYFSKNVREVSLSALSMYGAVAHAFTLVHCNHFGVTRLYLLLTYKVAAGIKVNHEEPGTTSIEVPGKNGTVTSNLFAECSVADMRKSIQRRRKPASSKPLPPADLVLADRYLNAVTGNFAKGEPIRVQVRNHEGRTVLDFRGIPLEQLDKLIKALQAQANLVRREKEVEKAQPVV